MSISMHALSVPFFSQSLANLSHVLAKGEASAGERKIDPAVLVNARLAPDMHPLKRQVQIATDNAKGACARLAGVDIPSFPDAEETFAELQTRIAAIKAFIDGLDPAGFEGAKDRDISLKFGPQSLDFKGLQYLQFFAVPNFLFHVVTTYDILRHNGVPLGKSTFFGRG